MAAAKSRDTRGTGRLWGHSQHLVSSSHTDTELPSRLFQTGRALLKPDGLEGRPAALREGICSDPRVSTALEKSRGGAPAVLRLPNQGLSSQAGGPWQAAFQELSL